MSKILKSCSHKNPIYSGFDCDVYEIHPHFVYKHYAPYKLGKMLYNRKPPTSFLKHIKNRNVEKALDYDDEGFVTHKIIPIGSYFTLKYQHLLQNHKDDIRRVLEKYKHNDLTPDNIGYHPQIGLVIFDWVQHDRKPYYDFLEDESLLKNIDNEHWFRKDNLLAIRSYFFKLASEFIFRKRKVQIDDAIQYAMNQVLYKTRVQYDEIARKTQMRLIDLENAFTENITSLCIDN